MLATTTLLWTLTMACGPTDGPLNREPHWDGHPHGLGGYATKGESEAAVKDIIRHQSRGIWCFPECEAPSD